MKLITIDQIVNIVNGITVFILSAALIWIAVNVVKYFAAANHKNKDAGGSAMLHSCVTLYATLVIWGILMLLKTAFF